MEHKGGLAVSWEVETCDLVCNKLSRSQEICDVQHFPTLEELPTQMQGVSRV